MITTHRKGFVRRRLALCAAAVSLAALAAAGLLAPAGGGDGTFLIPYEVYEAGGMPNFQRLSSLSSSPRQSLSLNGGLART